MSELKDMGDFVIAADDPCLDGHFPDRPVVPGVVLLERALALVLAELGDGARIGAIPRVKFKGFVLPDQVVTVSADCSGKRIVFRCRTAAGVMAEGQCEAEY